MKKIALFIVLFCLLFVNNSFSQLQNQLITKNAKHCILYKFGNSGNIQYFDSIGYILFGKTNNKFENEYASIFLGEDKASAYKTLQDLQYLKRNNFALDKTISVNGYNAITKIYRSHLFSGIVFETYDISGVTHIITWINFKKALASLDSFVNYNENKQTKEIAKK